MRPRPLSSLFSPPFSFFQSVRGLSLLVSEFIIDALIPQILRSPRRVLPSCKSMELSLFNHTLRRAYPCTKIRNGEEERDNEWSFLRSFFFNYYYLVDSCRGCALYLACCSDCCDCHDRREAFRRFRARHGQHLNPQHSAHRYHIQKR